MIVPVSVFLLHPVINPDSTFFRLLATGYALPLAMICGILVWASEFIRQSSAKVLLVVDLLLDTTQRVAKDYSHIEAGEQKMPSLFTLVGDVYEKLFLRIINEVVHKQLGVIGKPVYFAYRLTIDRVLRLVLRRKFDNAISDQGGEQELQSVATETMKEVSKNELKIVRGLETARKRIQTTSGRLKSLATLPCYVVLAIASLVLLTPLAILFLW